MGSYNLQLDYVRPTTPLQIRPLRPFKQDIWQPWRDIIETGQAGQTGQTKLTLKLDFPGNLCWAACFLVLPFISLKQNRPKCMKLTQFIS